MDIFMIRHGETFDNVDKVFSRDTTPLTPKGITQIVETKEQIKALNFTKVYYSPLTRTQETLNYLGLKGISEQRIREVDFGGFTGLNYETIVKTYPLESKLWMDDPLTYVIPYGESVEMAYARLKKFLEEVVAKDEDILLVVHEGIIRLVCCWVFDNLAYFFRFKAGNGSISKVSVVDGYKYLSQLNSKA